MVHIRRIGSPEIWWSKRYRGSDYAPKLHMSGCRGCLVKLLLCGTHSIRYVQLRSWGCQISLLTYGYRFSVILIYDWIITFGQEVSRFWKRELKRLPAILFFINRYLTVLGYIPIIALNFWNGPVFRGNVSCSLVQWFLVDKYSLIWAATTRVSSISMLSGLRRGLLLICL